MSMLKSSVAKAVAVAVALSAGSAAFAATGPNEGSSDLFIAVWNPSTNNSYVQDLGSSFSFSALDSGSFNTAGFSVSSAALDGGNLATALGAGTYTFALFAGDLSVAQNTFAQFQGNTMFYSQVAGGGATPLSNPGAFGAGNTVATYIDKNMNGGTTNPSSTTSFLAHDDGSSGSAYWASANNVNAPGSNFTLGGFNGAATGTGTLNLLKYFAATDSGSDPATVSFVGSAGNPGVFSLNDATGVLSYSDGSSGGTNTPLPAAGWLLVSGLLGLGAVGRRKAATAA